MPTPDASAANQPERGFDAVMKAIGHKDGCPHLFFEQGECNCGLVWRLSRWLRKRR